MSFPLDFLNHLLKSSIQISNNYRRCENHLEILNFWRKLIVFGSSVWNECVRNLFILISLKLNVANRIFLKLGNPKVLLLGIFSRYWCSAKPWNCKWGIFKIFEFHSFCLELNRIISRFTFCKWGMCISKINHWAFLSFSTIEHYFFINHFLIKKAYVQLGNWQALYVHCALSMPNISHNFGIISIAYQSTSPL